MGDIIIFSPKGFALNLANISSGGEVENDGERIKDPSNESHFRDVVVRGCHSGPTNLHAPCRKRGKLFD